MPFVVATYVYASSQGQRTHSARTKIVATYVYASSQGQRTHSARTKIQPITLMLKKIQVYSPKGSNFIAHGKFYALLVKSRFPASDDLTQLNIMDRTFMLITIQDLFPFMHMTNLQKKLKEQFSSISHFWPQHFDSPPGGPQTNVRPQNRMA